MYLQPRLIALVLVGGTIGVAVREGLALAFPYSGIPWLIAVINIIGAFLLGLILELLPRFGDDTGGRCAFRLFAGTGVLGGFTTYSALATDTARLSAEGLTAAGISYAVVSVVSGIVAASAGVIAARGVRSAPHHEVTDGDDAR